MASRGPLLLGALWAAAASLAVGVGLVAVDLVSGEVGEDVASPLSDDAVRRALVSSSTSPAATRTPHVEPDGDEGPLRTVTTAAGVVSARCDDGEPELVYATPAQGYRTVRSDDDLVRFSSSHRAVTVTMSCNGRLLQASTRSESLDPAPSPKPVTRAPQPSPTESEDHEPEESDSPSPEPEDSHDDESDD
jgi:hypothetical protein